MAYLHAWNRFYCTIIILCVHLASNRAIMDEDGECCVTEVDQNEATSMKTKKEIGRVHSKGI